MAIHLAAEREIVARMFLELLRNLHRSYLPDTTLAAAADLALVAIAVFLSERNGRVASVSAIARATGLSRPTIRRRLGDLGRRGYVVRSGRGYVMGAAFDLPTIRRVLRRHVRLIVEAARKLDNLAR